MVRAGGKRTVLTFAGTGVGWVELRPWWECPDSFSWAPFLSLPGHLYTFSWPKSDLRKDPAQENQTGRTSGTSRCGQPFITQGTKSSEGCGSQGHQPGSGCQKPVCCPKSWSRALLYKEESEKGKSRPQVYFHWKVWCLGVIYIHTWLTKDLPPSVSLLLVAQTSDFSEP